jgi:hypothetical protein
MSTPSSRSRLCSKKIILLNDVALKNFSPRGFASWSNRSTEYFSRGFFTKRRHQNVWFITYFEWIIKGFVVGCENVTNQYVADRNKGF